MPEMRLLLRDIDIPDIEHLDAYRAHGGYAALARVRREMNPRAVVDMVAEAGLRDRSGSWRALAPRWRELDGRAKYLCVSANESSPGAFRDRKLIERHPHQFLEGGGHCGLCLGGAAGLYMHAPGDEAGNPAFAKRGRRGVRGGLVGI